MMTDFNKYRNVSLKHETYSKLDRLSKTITPGIQISISKTIEALVSDRLANPDLDGKVDSSTDGSLDLSVEVPDGLPDKIKKLKNIDFTEEEDIESE